MPRPVINDEMIMLKILNLIPIIPIKPKCPYPAQKNGNKSNHTQFNTAKSKDQNTKNK